MTTQQVSLKAGPAGDVLICVGAREIFATAQKDYLLASPLTLAENGAALLLEPSGWWYDSGFEPEIMRIERSGDILIFTGTTRRGQTHDERRMTCGECMFNDWNRAMERLE